LSGIRSRLGNIAQLQQFLRRIQHHCSHESNYVHGKRERRSLFVIWVQRS
jgi:hypothetical protein